MKKIAIALMALTFSFTSFSQTEATTNDGRKVTLNEDGTYTWNEEKPVAETSSEGSEGNYYVNKHVDDMTDKVYYYSSSDLLCQDKAIDTGFRLSYSINGKTDNEIKIDGFSMVVVGLECLEKTVLLFLFDDGSKLSLTSWNDFNCKGNAWYTLTSAHLKQLSTKTIKKIRVQNGRNFKAYTHELEGLDKNYFINMYNSVEAKDIRLKQFDE